MSAIGTKITAAAIVFTLVSVAWLVWRNRMDDQQRKIMDKDFSAGTTRAQVIEVMGQPTREAPVAEDRTLSHSCAPRAISFVEYSSRDAGSVVLVHIYLDGQQRVICSQRTLIAV